MDPTGSTPQLDTTTAAQLPDDTPEWIVTAKTYLDTVSDDPRWKDCVSQWLEFEKTMGYPRENQSPTARLSAKNRPIQVRQWLQNCRNYDTVPSLGKVTEYGTVWRLWWTTLQPDARPRTDSNGLTRKRLAPDAWEPLKRAGPNGLFIPLISLAWWVKASASDSLEVESAFTMVEDFGWVLLQLIGESSKGGEGEDGASSERPKKRPKVATAGPLRRSARARK
ncbi:hypothetical protein C8Q79DRAFT_1079413 [Trametes meyenii]|nr:hypothetical protein C8Q79DRAFT_1079413 [Trametes meyenii]